MERKLAQPTFTDALMLDYGSPRMAAFFAQMDAVVPWDRLGRVHCRRVRQRRRRRGGRWLRRTGAGGRTGRWC